MKYRDTATPRSLRTTLAACGIVAAVLGLAVLAGWFAGLPGLVQLSPELTPMAPRSALSFLLFGSALVALSARRRLLCQTLAGIVALANAWTLLEYSTSMGIDLDRVLQFGPLPLGHRVAPNTAVCFLLLSTALFLIGSRRVFRGRPVVLAGLASTTTAASLISLAGYLSGVRTFEWAGLTPMAPQTCLGLVLLSIALLVYIWQWERDEVEAGAPSWLFVAASLVAAVFAVSLWQALAAEAGNQARGAIAADATEISDHILAQMRLRTAVLVRAARRWEQLGKPSQTDWEFETSLLLSDVLDFRAVEWVDPDLRIRSVAPWKGNERLLHADLSFEPRRRAAFESARNLRRAVLTRTIDLLTGGRGIQIYVPVFKDGACLGFVAGNFLVEELLPRLVPPSAAPGEQFEILDGSEIIFTLGRWKGRPPVRWSEQAVLDFDGARWTLRMWPSPEKLTSLRSRLPETVLMVGILLAALVGAAVFLAQQAWTRTRIAEALRRSVEKETADRLQAVQELDQFFNLSLEMLCIAGVDGWFKRVNPAFERVLGYAPEELLARPFLDYVHPGDRDQTVSALKELADGLPLSAFENRYRARDGTIRWIQWACAPVPGRSVVFASARDITERKAAQDALRRVHAELEERVTDRTAALAQSQAEVLKLNRQLENQVLDLTAANQELEAFTYSVSHDLRAPLRHIDGFSKILMDDYRERLPEEARPLLDRVRQGSQRMGRMVDELLELSRTARRQPDKRLTGLRSLVDEVIADLTAETHERVVEWRIGDLPFADCDPALTRQIFVNLLSNALKFTRPREKAVIEVGQMDAEEAPAIFVRDNGVGFSMKYADKLFGAFQRLHRQEDFEGTGVGLATVQRIVHKHGGRIWAEAALDRGATFFFTLAPAEMENSPTPEVLEVHDVKR